MSSIEKLEQVFEEHAIKVLGNITKKTITTWSAEHNNSYTLSTVDYENTDLYGHKGDTTLFTTLYQYNIYCYSDNETDAVSKLVKLNSILNALPINLGDGVSGRYIINNIHLFSSYTKTYVYSANLNIYNYLDDNLNIII